VEVTDITSNVTTVFTSIKQAANGIGVNEKTIANFEKKLNKEKQQETNNNLYRNQFIIKFIRNNNNNAPSNK
jgi:septal ring factor EnvC (AmiA/AmiB activator)